MALCTDSVDPEELLEKGYLDGALRSALKLGIPPARAYPMVTINVAEHFRLDHKLGSLSPGKAADIVFIPSPLEYEPQRILIGGRKVFAEGKSLVEPRRVEFPEALFTTMNISGYQLDEPQKRGRCRAMELVNRLVTREKVIDFENPEEAADVLYCVALDRTGGKQSFTGFLQGFGLKQGACGTTSSWDTVDMICAGVDMVSIRTVIERLKEIGGGAVFAVGVLPEAAVVVVGVQNGQGLGPRVPVGGQGGASAQQQDGQDRDETGQLVKSHCLPPFQNSTPTMAPVIIVARTPARMDRGPSSTISAARSGAMRLNPPMRIPRLPTLANPHME